MRKTNLILVLAIIALATASFALPPEFTESVPNQSWYENYTKTIYNLSQYVEDPEGDDVIFNVTVDCIQINATVNETTTDVLFESSKGWTGSCNAGINATDNNSNSSVFNITLDVNENSEPYFISFLPDQTIPESRNHTMYNLSQYINDSDGDNITIGIVMLCQNITAEINSSTTDVVFTPSFGWTGSCNATVNATDSFSPSIFRNVSLYVVENVHPQLNNSPITLSSWNEDNNSSVDLYYYFWDPDGDELFFNYTFLYENTNISVIINQSSGIATLDPYPNWYGTKYIRFSASDEEETVYSSPYTELNVISVNDPPTLLKNISAWPQDYFSIYEDSSLTINLSGYFIDVEDGTNIIYSIASASPDFNISFNNSNQSVIFVPNENWNGYESFRIVAEDTEESQIESNQFIIYVTAVADPPETINSTPYIEMDEDTIIQVNVTQWVYDPDYDAVFYYTQTASAQLNISINIETGIANISAPSDYTGSEEINFTADDGVSTANTTLTVNVTDVNDAPELVSPIPNITWNEDTADTSINLSVYFSDPEGNQINYSVYLHPSNITISINQSSGTVSLVPYADWSGQSYAIFNATDSHNASSQSNTVLLTVLPANDAPNITGVSVVSENGTNKYYEDLICSANASDADGNSLSYSGEWVKGGVVFVGEDWNFTLDDGLNESGEGVALGGDGSFYVAASLRNISDYDIWLLKFSGGLESLWNFSFDSGGNSDYAGDVVVFGGDVYVVGSAGGDVYLAKLDSDGVLYWNVTTDVSGSVYSVDLDVDGSGDVFVTGVFSGNFTLLKYDGSSGVLLWESSVDSGFYDNAYSVVVDSVGDAVVTGYNSTSGREDYFTVKFDGSDGSHVWNRSVDLDDDGVCYSSAVDGEDNILLGCIDYLPGINSGRFFVIKYDGDGNNLWNASYDALGVHDKARAIDVDGFGNVYVVGEMDSTVDNVRVVKFDPDGVQLWNYTYESVTSSRASGVVVSSNGAVYSVGEQWNGNNYDLRLFSYMDGFVIESQDPNQEVMLSSLPGSFTSSGDNWSCFAEVSDGLASSENSSQNITLLAAETEAPNITLISPENDSTWTSSSSVAFAFNVSDNSGIYSCSVIIDGSLASSSSQIANNEQNTISYAPGNGEHNWSINCTDSSPAENTASSDSYSITVSYTAPRGGGGGGSRASCTELWNCTEWGKCNYPGTRTRSCTDANSCGTYNYLPALSSECEYIPSCSDFIKNQDETDVDCGGSICTQCRDGKSCISDSDCRNICIEGICSAYEAEKPSPVLKAPQPVIPPPAEEKPMEIKESIWSSTALGIPIWAYAIAGFIGIVLVAGGIILSMHQAAGAGKSGLINPLFSAIERDVRRGVPESSIRQALLNAGWSASVADRAIAEVNRNIIEPYAMSSISYGKDESKLKSSFESKGWPAEIVDDAIEDANLAVVESSIELNLSKGFSLSSIEQSLLAKGWPESTVEKAMMRFLKR